MRRHTPYAVFILLALAAALLHDTPPVLLAARPLHEQVTIRRDAFGVPHIAAESDEAAAFALGYAQAEDHTVALARWLLSGRGEAARYFGETYLTDDVAAQRIRGRAEAQEGLASVDPTFRRMLAAFAAGINRYVATHRDQVPAWMPEFTAADVLGGTRDDASSGGSSPAILRALREKYPGGTAVPALPSTSPPAPTRASADALAAPDEFAGADTLGSNALALAGSRTTSGHAMLLGNPHLSWRARYWEAHVTIPGRLDFYGSTLIGYPWLRAGFNRHLGYVQTNNAPDLEDVYALTLDPARPDHYVFEGRSRPLERREATIAVKQADGTLREQPVEFWDSHIGPVVYRTPEKAFAVASSRRRAWRYFEGFWRLSQARSLTEFTRVMRMGIIPQSNFTYADAEGNILYVWNAMIARRVADGTSYELDVPGDTGRYVWRGLHPFADLPRLLNPSGGYVQNANNAPWYASTRDALEPWRYPTYFERRELALRPQAALEMLDAREKFSPDDVIALKYSTRMLLAERVKPALLQAVAQVPEPGEDLRAGRDVLAAWDDHVSAGSVGAVLFQRFWDAYRAKVPQPFAVRWDAARPMTTPSGLADWAQARAVLEQAVRDTRQAHGRADVAWGDVHRFRFGDLDLPADGAPGAYGLYRVMGFDALPSGGGTRVAGQPPGAEDLVGTGDAWVLLVHFTRPVQAWSVLAYGQTTQAGSRHSRDQIALFAEHRLRPVWFEEADVQANTTRSYRP